MHHVQNVLAVKIIGQIEPLGSPSITRENCPSLCGNVSKTSFHSNHIGYAILMFRWVDIPACSVCLLYVWACDIGQGETLTAFQYTPVHLLAHHINHCAAECVTNTNISLSLAVFSYFGHLEKVNFKWLDYETSLIYEASSELIFAMEILWLEKQCGKTGLTLFSGKIVHFKLT